MSIRSLIENFSRGVILKRKLPIYFERRTMYVSPEIGGLRYWRFNLSKADPELLELVKTHIKPGNVVWDIGANLGLFTFSSAVQVGKTGQVLTVEPDAEVLQLLQKTKRKNLDLNVSIIAGAVSNEVGVAKFNIAERARTTNFLDGVGGSTQTGGVRFTVHTLTVTLDFLAQHFPMPDFLKIDVEGAELMVLQGGDKVLSEKKPIIWCEVYERSLEGVKAILNNHGYTNIQVIGENILALPPG